MSTLERPRRIVQGHVRVQTFLSSESQVASIATMVSLHSSFVSVKVAFEVADRGINVNAVCPSQTKTDMLLETMTEEEIVINEPVQIHRVVGDIGQEVVRCSYWMLFSNTPTVTISRQNILAHAEDLHPGTIKHYEAFLKYQQEHTHELDDNDGERLELIKQELKKRMNKPKHDLDKQLEQELNQLDAMIQKQSSNTTVH